MHSVTFQLKRAHLQGVVFGRKAVEKRVPGMTPARFDLLYAIRRHNASALTTQLLGYSMRQDHLRAALGLHPSTVSKMLRRLAQMGWVTKAGAPDDRRSRIVELTKEGAAAIQKAMRIIFRQRIHLRHFEELFKQLKPDRHVLLVINDFWTTVDEVARRFGDISTLEYEFGLARN